MQYITIIVSLIAILLSIYNFIENLVEKSNRLDIECLTASPHFNSGQVAYSFDLTISNKSKRPISITKMCLIIDEKEYHVVQQPTELPMFLMDYEAKGISIVSTYYDMDDLVLRVPQKIEIKILTSRGTLTKHVTVFGLSPSTQP